MIKIFISKKSHIYRVLLISIIEPNVKILINNILHKDLLSYVKIFQVQIYMPK